MNTLLLTCVHYRNEAQVRRFVDHVRSLPLPPGWRLEVVVADNSGDWSDTSAVPDGVLVVDSGENRGYFGGCVAAYDAWRAGRAAEPAWLAIVNTDLEFAPDVFGRLVDRRLPPEVGVVAPNVVLPNGARQNPFMRGRPTSWGLYGYMQVWRVPALSRIWDVGFEAKRRIDGAWGRLVAAPASPEPIYAPHGSAVFLRGPLLDRVELAFRGFMYFEELHIAELARRADMQVLFVPDLLVRHDEHSATGSVGRARRWRWKHQSTRAVLEDYFR